MRIILLGTGGPKPDPDRQGPAVLVGTGDRNILFDTGRGVVTQLVRVGVEVKDIDLIFLTHHHFDHINSLGDVLMSAWNLGRTDPITVFGPEGTASIVDSLINRIYKRDIAFRLREAELSGVKLADTDQMVISRDVGAGIVYDEGGISIRSEFVLHGHGLGISQDGWKCLGYRIEAKGHTVSISGDAVDCHGLDLLAKGSDGLVICCYLSKNEMLDKESRLIADHILACSPQIGRIATRAGVKKVILTHFRQKDEMRIKELVAEVKSDFNGEVIAGRDLLTIDF